MFVDASSEDSNSGDSWGTGVGDAEWSETTEGVLNEPKSPPLICEAVRRCEGSGVRGPSSKACMPT